MVIPEQTCVTGKESEKKTTFLILLFFLSFVVVENIIFLNVPISVKLEQ